MTQIYKGIITGGRREDRLIALAGALAECGVTSIQVQLSPARSVTLSARETDLPGLLAPASAHHAILYADSGTIVTVAPETMDWTTERADVAAALTRAQGRLTPGS